MKAELTIEESAKLIELGVDRKLASRHTLRMDIPTDIPNLYRKGEDSKPIFTLTDLLSILPKEIVLESGLHCDLKMQCVYKNWTVGYTPYAMSIFRAPELIDALYQLLIWAIENRHIELTEESR